jgi:NADPH2:quinone reductase
MSHKLHAIVVESQGNAPHLRDLSAPDLRAGQVRIKVNACALNFADLLMIEGRYQDMPPFPLTPGMEISGEILEIGPDVANLQVGLQVVAFSGHGGLASETVVDATRCIPRPKTMDDITGAAFLIAYGTSHLALTRRAALSKGEHLVVLGAGGGVGLTAVEIGAALGAKVTAVARGSDKLTAARDKGAAHVIDSDTTDDLRSALKSIGPVDVVYDAVGGALGDAAMRCLAPEGRHLLIGFASGDLPALKPNHMLVKNISAIGVYWGNYLTFHPEALKDSLSTLMEWHAAGRIKPHVSHVLPIERATEALQLLRDRKSTGKIVVTP